MIRAFPLLLLLSLGCFPGTRPQVWHSPQPVPAVPAGAPRPDLALEVLPLRVPEALQRPQLVLVTGPGTYEVSEVHHWANGLEGDLQRVLVENLGRLLGSGNVVAAPGGSTVKAALRLDLEVLQCEGRPGGSLILRASWCVLGPGKQPLARQVASFEVPVPGKDIPALVRAHSTAMGLLARDIVKGLATLP